MREVRRAAIQAQKNCKETLPRARRLTKEMMLYWKKYDKVEKEHRKRAEKEALEQRKLDEEMREVGEMELVFTCSQQIIYENICNHITFEYMIKRFSNCKEDYIKEMHLAFYRLCSRRSVSSAN